MINSANNLNIFEEVLICPLFRPEVNFNIPDEQARYFGRVRVDPDYLVVCREPPDEDWCIPYHRIMAICIDYHKFEIRIIQGSIFFVFLFREQCGLKPMYLFHEVLSPRLSENALRRYYLPPIVWDDYHLARSLG